MSDDVTRWLRDDLPGQPLSVEKQHYTYEEIREFDQVTGYAERYHGRYRSEYSLGFDPGRVADAMFAVGDAFVTAFGEMSEFANQVRAIEEQFTQVASVIRRKRTWTEVKQEMQDRRDYRASLNQWADDGGTVGLVDY